MIAFSDRRIAAGARRGAFRAAVAVIGVAALSLSACGGLPEGEAGDFAPEVFFDGESFSKGEITTFLFFSEEFTARFHGEGSPGRLQIDEIFRFEDGERLQRWDLVRVGPARYEGTVRTEAGDGSLREPVPVEGRLTANGAILDYDGYAPGGGDMLLHFTHHMEMQADGTVRNDVTVSKFGIPVATSRVVFAKSREALAGR